MQSCKNHDYISMLPKYVVIDRAYETKLLCARGSRDPSTAMQAFALLTLPHIV